MLDQVQFTTLPNGARVITAPQADAESVAVGFWVGVGGRHETPAVAGAISVRQMTWDEPRSFESRHRRPLMGSGARHCDTPRPPAPGVEPAQRGDCE